MYLNETITLLTILIEFSFLLLSFVSGKEWLYAVIVANLLLVSAFGAKLIMIFGLVTNAGNVFYATVFLATYLLIERHGKQAGYGTVRVGIVSIVFFIVMAQFTGRMLPEPSSEGINQALAVIFKATPRIAVASMLAYLVAQSANVAMYSWLRSRDKAQPLVVRAAGAIVIAQALDSAIFFSIAFGGLMPFSSLATSMFIGFLVKVTVCFLGIPVIAIGRRMKPTVT